MSVSLMAEPIVRASYEPYANPATVNLSPEKEDCASSCEQAPKEGYFSRIAKAITLPVIKNVDQYFGKWQSADLQEPATTQHLLQLAETGSETLNAMASPEADATEIWDNALDSLEDENQLLALNTLLNSLATPASDPHEGLDTQDDFLKALPETAKAYLLKQRENLSNNFLFHSGHMLFNLFSPNWQKSLLRNIPNSFKASIMASLKSGLFENKYLKPFLPTNAPSSSADNNTVTNNTTTTDNSTEATTAKRTEIQKPLPLTDAEITQYSKELWTLAADCLHAARLEEPDPEKAQEAHTPKRNVAPEERNANMRAAIKAHLPLFERILSQPNFPEVLDQLCERGQLPKSIAQLLQEKFHKNGDASTNIFDTARKILSNLSPIMAESDKIALIDQVPDEDIGQLTTDMNQMLSDIDPYVELPFYQEFSNQLANSIKVKPVRIVAEQLTKHYFQALKNYPEFQRSISVAILKLGPDASMGKRIGAIAQAAGLGFQKSMQLFSRDIQDPEIREALEDMKQDVTPMPHEKVVNIIRQELAKLSERERETYRFELANPENIGNVLKSATVGQVHPAILKVTDQTLPYDHPDRTYDAKVALKVKRDGLQERCLQEEDGLKIALDKALAESLKAADEEAGGAAAFGEAVKITIEELFENIRREIDFEGTEYENAQVAKVLYEGQQDGVQLKSANCLAATDNLLIQEWAPGASINKQWDALCEKAETEDNFSERLQFAQGVNTALRLELSKWISAYVNGDGKSTFYLDGDRHDGNGHYDPKSKTFTVFDFGAGLRLSPAQSRTLNKLTAAISTGSATATLHYLLKLMPEKAKAKLTAEDKAALKAQIKVHIRNPDDATRLNDIHGHLTDAKVWPQNLSIQQFSEKMDALGLRHKLLRGKLTPNCTPPTGHAVRRTEAMIEVLMACGVRGGGENQFTPKEISEISKAVNNEFQVLYTGVDVSNRVTHQLTDDYHELFLVKTLARLAECFVDAGLPAPGIVLQLNRGAKMLGDKIEENNQRIAELHAERPRHPHPTRDQNFLDKLKPTDVGNVFMSALRPNFLKFMRYRLRSRFATNWREDRK